MNIYLLLNHLIMSGSDEEFTIIRGKNPAVRNSDKETIVTKKHHRDGNQLSKKLDSDDPPAVHRTTPEITRTIIDARAAKGWKQDDLARNACLHKQIIQKYEIVGTPISRADLNKMCRALGIDEIKI